MMRRTSAWTSAGSRRAGKLCTEHLARRLFCALRGCLLCARVQKQRDGPDQQSGHSQCRRRMPGTKAFHLRRFSAADFYAGRLKMQLRQCCERSGLAYGRVGKSRSCDEATDRVVSELLVGNKAVFSAGEQHTVAEIPHRRRARAQAALGHNHRLTKADLFQPRTPALQQRAVHHIGISFARARLPGPEHKGNLFDRLGKVVFDRVQRGPVRFSLQIVPAPES